MIPHRSMAVALSSVALTLGLVLSPSAAQENDAPEPKTEAPPSAESSTAEAKGTAERQPPEPEAPKTYPPYRRVPRHFGQIGLSRQQKEEVYILRGRYRAEIAALERRIEELRQKEMMECESVLTDAQRKLLEQLRTISGSGR